MKNKNVGTCALAAAAEAVFGVAGNRIAALSTLYPVLMDAAACPACSEAPGAATVADQVMHLNDVHRWSRERIADWVSVLEIRRESIKTAKGQRAALKTAQRLVDAAFAKKGSPAPPTAPRPKEPVRKTCRTA